MKPILLIPLILFVGCHTSQNEAPVQPTSNYQVVTQTTNGRTSLSSIIAIVVTNPYGGIAVYNPEADSILTWTLNKNVRPPNLSDSTGYLDRISNVLSISNDTLYVTIVSPVDPAILPIQLTLMIPNSIPCIFKTVRDNLFIVSTSGQFFGDNLNTISYEQYQGTSIFSQVTGNVGGKLSFSDSDSCLIECDNGNILLSIDRTSNCSFDLLSSDSSITYKTLPLSNVNQTQTTLTGVLGTGKVKVSLVTKHGSIAISGY